MPRKKAEKPEATEEQTEETMNRTLDEQKEAVLSDPDEKSPEDTEGESSGEEISQTETENLENKMTLSSGTKEQEGKIKGSGSRRRRQASKSWKKCQFCQTGFIAGACY